MKKLLCLVLALTMLMSLALISPAAAEDWKFERKIEIVCPWGLGGGADSTIRPMATLLQQKLGVPVEVRNETGAGGVQAEALTEALADRFYALEIRDQTRLAEDLWSRAEEDSLRGLFLRDLKARLEDARTATPSCWAPSPCSSRICWATPP